MRPYVALRHIRFARPEELADAVDADRPRAGAFDGEEVDFLDGVMFSADRVAT